MPLRWLAIKTVEGFTHLGSLIVSNGKFIQDTERRRLGATRDFGMVRRRKERD